MATRRKRRSDGRYESSVRYEKPDGTRGRRTVYADTQAELERRLTEVRARVQSGAPVRDSSATLKEWLEEWRSTSLRASDLARSTKNLYARLTINWVEPSIGSIRLDRLKPSDITRMLLGMEDAGKAGSTRRSAYAALRGALADAVRNGLMTDNPAERVKRPRADQTEARSLDPEEVSRLLKGAEGLRYITALKIILGTGLRRGEALALRWEDVDLERGVARVKGTLVRQDDGPLEVVKPKTSRSRRVVSLSPAMVTLLKAHRARQLEERSKAANLWHNTGYVFATEFGQPVDPRNLRRAVQIAARKAELGKGIHVHALRHTFATTALLGGEPLHAVSRGLGHSSVTITGDIYGHLTDDASRSIAETVSVALGL
jgi:integrase